MTKIKFCGFTSADLALDAALLGVDAIGLNFVEQSPRYVTLDQAQSIVDVLPPFVTKVGLFVNPTVDFVNQVLSSVALNCFQFHGDEDPVFCNQFQKPYIKVFRVRPNDDLKVLMEPYKMACGFLLDAYNDKSYGGTGESFDWSFYPHDIEKPIILAGGLTIDNVEQAILSCRPYAVDVSSGIESHLGTKCKNKMQSFIERVKNCA